MHRASQTHVIRDINLFCERNALAAQLTDIGIRLHSCGLPDMFLNVIAVRDALLDILDREEKLTIRETAHV